MSEWLGESLKGSIIELREKGMTTLADDLHRLLCSGEVDNIRLFRSQTLGELAEYLEDIHDIGDLKVFLHHLAVEFGVEHFTLHCCNQAATDAFDTRVVTTYPKRWVTKYVEKSYSRVDPVLAKAEEAAIGFFWDEIDFSFPLSDSFHKAAALDGIGPSGYTLPLTFPENMKVGCTLTSVKPAATFRKAFTHRQYDLRLLMESLSEVYFRLAAKSGNKGMLPNDLIYKFMLGLTCGETLDELQNRLKFNDLEGVTEQVCTFYKAKTLHQAVAECLRLGHLDDRPFELVEIQH